MNSPLLKQSWVMSGVLINTVAQGMTLSYPSSLVPALLDPSSSMKVDLNTAAWVGSSLSPSYAVGALLASILMDLIGRKKTQLITILPGLIGWVLLYFATNVTSVMCGRVLTGFTSGATISVAAVVIGEYTSPKYRGVFLNLKTAGCCVGSMSVHVIAYYLSWRGIALAVVAPHVVIILITLTCPESPAWLASVQKYQESKQSFYWLRGSDKRSRKEIDEMITIQMSTPKRETKSYRVQNISNLLKKLTERSLMKPIFIITVGMVLIEVCGRHVFPAFALQIIGEMMENKSDSFYYTIVIDIIITVSAVSSSVLVKMMKRRTLLFSTGFAAVSVLATGCTYLYLVSLGILSKDRPWISVLLFVMFFILANLGSTPIPLALLGEVYPLAYRGVGTTTAAASISLFSFVALQMTPHMLLVFKVHGMFAIFGTVMAVCLIILYCTLPETKDRTLQEIENFFNYGKYERDAVEDDEAKTIMIESDVKPVLLSVNNK